MRGTRVWQRCCHIASSGLTHLAALRLGIPGLDRWPLERSLLLVAVLCSGADLYGQSLGILLGGDSKLTLLIFDHFVLLVWRGQLQRVFLELFELHVAHDEGSLGRRVIESEAYLFFDAEAVELAKEFLGEAHGVARALTSGLGRCSRLLISCHMGR